MDTSQSLALAAERFDALANVAEKMKLARKAARRFGRRLKNRDADITMVTSGYRMRREASGGHNLLPEPCVVVVVRQKWREGAAPSGAAVAPLPARLLVRAGGSAAGSEYGVPTDVQPAAWFEGSVAHRANGIEVAVGSYPDGAIACAVRVDKPTGADWLALSALHVLTPFPSIDGGAAGGAEILSLGDSVDVGASTPWSGQLRSSGDSFDAQLARVNRNWFNTVFAGYKLAKQPCLRSRADLDQVAPYSRFLVLAPANHAMHIDTPRLAIGGQFDTYVNADQAIEYGLSSDGVTYTGLVRHAELFTIAAGSGSPVSEPGDSGSAVVAFRDGEMVLAGMLIAGPAPGSGLDRMFVLPAWQLFDVASWKGGLPPGATKLTPSFYIP